MYKQAKPFFIICETPLHAGSGNDLGIVDLPIQREKHTQFPKIESSSLKGSIREAFSNLLEFDEKKKEYSLPDSDPIKRLSEEGKFSDLEKFWKRKKDGKETDEIQKDKKGNKLTKFQNGIALSFGPDAEDVEAHAGALGFTEARLLLFPVKSMKGVFAWITCPYVLQRLVDDLKLCKPSITPPTVKGIKNAVPNITTRLIYLLNTTSLY